MDASEGIVTGRPLPYDPFGPDPDQAARIKRLENIQIRLAILGTILKASSYHDLTGKGLNEILNDADTIKQWVTQEV